MKTIAKNTKKVFYVACSEGGCKISDLAFGNQKELLIAIATRECRKQICSPIAMIFVFPSADSYYRKEAPMAHYLSPEIKIKRERVRCHSHQQKPGKEPPFVETKNGLPDCFRCREEIILSAMMG